MSAQARVPWSHDELVMVCGLYFTLPFGRMHSRNPEIVAVARLLGRTPASVAMKLVNFASLDPAQQARGIRGLTGHSRADEEVWREFQTDWDRMAVLSEARLQTLERASGATKHADVATEAKGVVKLRIMQGFFRKAVLAAYNSTCCVTGNPVSELLVASHILPWSVFPKERLNPSNGLCLAAHFDRAFDRGLITFDERLRLVLSPALRRHLPNRALQVEFVRREGRALVLPDRFGPDHEFVRYHRGEIFRAD